MNFRKRIVISNVLMVLVPVIVTIGLWMCYLAFGNGLGVRIVNQGADEAGSASRAHGVANVLQAELSYLHWDVNRIVGVDGQVVVLKPDEGMMSELENLGFHLRVESPDGFSYNNFDESDVEAVRNADIQSDGAALWSGDSIVIQDAFEVEGQTFHLTAVYNERRADQGMMGSLVPLYMVSPPTLLAFLVVAVIVIVATALLLSRWLNQSVLEPLDELKAAADRIASDDLDHGISYAKHDEFGEVCDAFDKMRVRLKDAEAENERFEDERRELFQGISHDLRSPLTSIKGYAMGLKDGVADTEEKRQRYYDAIITRSDDLERLTDRLSLVTRLEAGDISLQLESLPVESYVRELVDEKAVWLEENRVAVELSSSAANIEAQLDPHEMRRVFDNLFENTVRYRMADESHVRIFIDSQGESVEVRYRDDGPGVSAEHLDRIFESFYRVDDSRTKPGQGSGLGLAIVKRVVEGHGGSVRAQSEGEGGLEIIMELPVASGKTSPSRGSLLGGMG